MPKTADYTRKAIDKYRDKNDFINLKFPKGTKEKLKEMGISNSDLANECLNFIARTEETMNNENSKQQKPAQVTHNIGIGSEIKAYADQAEEPEPEPPCEENNFDGLMANEWNREQHKGKVPYPPNWATEDTCWNAKKREWYDKLPFS